MNRRFDGAKRVSEHTHTLSLTHTCTFTHTLTVFHPPCISHSLTHKHTCLPSHTLSLIHTHTIHTHRHPFPHFWEWLFPDLIMTWCLSSFLSSEIDWIRRVNEICSLHGWTSWWSLVLHNNSIHPFDRCTRKMLSVNDKLRWRH